MKPGYPTDQTVFAARRDLYPEPQARQGTWLYPAGDRYFLGRADFSKGVSLVSLTDTNGKGKRFWLDRQLLLVRAAVCARRIPADDLHHTNGFDKQHYKFDYVRGNSSAKCAA